MIELIFVISVVSGQCDRCSGTGKIICYNCQGTGKVQSSEPIETCEYCLGFGVIQPTITKKSAFAQTGDKEVFVSGTFENDQTDGIYGIAIAEVIGEITTYTNSSEMIYFPPNEEILVTVIVNNIPNDDWNWISKFGNLKTNIFLSNIDSISCPLCGGDGILTPLSTCSICYGTGFTDCPDCNSNFGITGGVTTIGVIAIIGLVILSTFIIRRRKIAEKDLRKMSFYEYQNWIIEKLSVERAQIRDSRLGIDGYTKDGEAIQINQSHNVGKAEVYKFANILSKKKIRRGIIIAFNFNDDVFEAINGARQHFRVIIETVMVKQLID